MQTKYIFVTGGVVSGVGKGITTASLGRLLKSRGYTVSIQKFDPYLNVDPGTMSPYQHGEVFVTDDGAEADLDLGHYERFIDENLTCYSTVTTGKIYWSVISKERKGDYLGDTVQVIPHITNEIKANIHKLANRDTDIVITEIGGTVGDIESLPYLEAIRQVAYDVGRNNVLYVHVTLIPFLETSCEPKSKPTQHSVKELLSLGIQPDVIVCRTKYPMSREFKDKIALFCNVPSDCIIDNIDVPSIYALPLMLEREGLANVVCHKLQLSKNTPDLTDWQALVSRCVSLDKQLDVALVGKYVALRDAYISIAEALTAGGIAVGAKINIHYIDSELHTETSKQELIQQLSGMDAILVPGGFGDRGIDGKLLAIQYAREHNVPFFGICLGMQLACVEYAQHVLGLDAHSTELCPNTPAPVIDIMPSQQDVTEKGGTMRLGLYPCDLQPDTLSAKAYGCASVDERHRHRYEFNNEYRPYFNDGCFNFAGLSPDGKLVEIIELRNHPYFVAVQFHPEFKSRPDRAHPLLRAFVQAAYDRKYGNNAD